MGAFNEVEGDAVCSHCGLNARFVVQFKYGDTWQLEYRLGDKLRWGGNDEGEPGLPRVVVEGIGELKGSVTTSLLMSDLRPRHWRAS